jgi:hypothetical protein
MTFDPEVIIGAGGQLAHSAIAFKNSLSQNYARRNFVDDHFAHSLLRIIVHVSRNLKKRRLRSQPVAENTQQHKRQKKPFFKSV